MYESSERHQEQRLNFTFLWLLSVLNSKVVGELMSTFKAL